MQGQQNYDLRYPYFSCEMPAFTVTREALTGLHYRRAKALHRKHLLGLDDYLLRDIGLSRLDVMEGRF